MRGRVIRPSLVLSLPPVSPDAEGRISESAFEQYSTALLEWSRAVGSLNSRGTYTPVLSALTTNPTLGTDPEIFGAWAIVGGICHFHAFIRFGTAGTAAGNGAYTVSLPFRTYDTSRTRALLDGTAELSDSGTRYRRLLRWFTPTTVIMESAVDPPASVAHNAPFAWGASDFMILNGWFEPATHRAINL